MLVLCRPHLGSRRCVQVLLLPPAIARIVACPSMLQGLTHYGVVVFLRLVTPCAGAVAASKHEDVAVNNPHPSILRL